MGTRRFQSSDLARLVRADTFNLRLHPVAVAKENPRCPSPLARHGIDRPVQQGVWRLPGLASARWCSSIATRADSSRSRFASTLNIDAAGVEAPERYTGGNRENLSQYS